MSGHGGLLPPPNLCSLSLNFYNLSAGLNMKRFSITIALFGGIWLAVAVPAGAAPCLIVTLTGTQSGPAVFNGQAGAGTLVRYGDDSNNCAAMKLQFDAGRGTNMRLSQVDVTPVQLNAIFFSNYLGQFIRRS
jgi:ribonuclease Z